MVTAEYPEPIRFCQPLSIFLLRTIRWRGGRRMWGWGTRLGCGRKNGRIGESTSELLREGSLAVR